MVTAGKSSRFYATDLCNAISMVSEIAALGETDKVFE
jgi:hypothetical protein